MIEVKNVVYSYHNPEDEDEEVSEVVLNDLSLRIERDKHTCLLGHNGSGKSTLAKLLIGLDFPQKGEIFIDGIEVNKKNIFEVRNKVGIVFQNPDNQFIGATVADDIAFGLENHCIPTEEMPGIIEKYATKVGMQDYLKHEPTRLSGGQKQRVAIAGILAMNPEIMIFDEATSMLDPVGVKEVNESMNNLRQESKTLISITHDIEYALTTDYIIVLEKGRVIFEGQPQDVFKYMDELVKIGLDIPFTLKLINSLNEEGFDLKPCLSLEELEQQLCQ